MAIAATIDFVSLLFLTICLPQAGREAVLTFFHHWSLRNWAQFPDYCSFNYGVYQIGLVYALSWTVVRTSSGIAIPKR
jgi:hypothetical protein